ncbi:hypothetical protein [Streptomyces sp. NPDC059515]|uniref:restriction endonuclease subunit S n=1 Tax=Streptomyces sp. NPDC059515 TaxID=3346854 RepID=UPI0036C8D095
MGGELHAYPEVPLKDLLRRVETGWSPVCSSKPPGPDEWGVIKLSAITSGRFIETETKTFPSGSAPRKELEIRTRDLLMSRANGVKSLVGVVCTVGEVRQRLLLPDLVFRLVPNGDKVDPAFLGLALSTAGLRSQIEAAMRGTSGQYKISQADVRRLRVPLPDLDEQRRIVVAHAVVERRISALERVREKLKTLRDSLTADLVAGPMEKVGKILATKPKNGFSPVEVSEWTGLLTLGLGCLTPEGFQPRQLKRLPASDVASRFQLADGDLLMSRANTRDLVGLVGRYQDVGHPCIYPDLMMRLRPDSRRCIPHYLEIVLRSAPVRKAIQAGARGTSESMVKISADLVESLRVPVPSLEKQEQVVKSFSALDRKIRSCQSVIDKLRSVQQGVVEEMLTGRVLVA